MRTRAYVFGGSLVLGLAVSGKWRQLLHAFGIRTEYTPSYQVLSKDNDKEIRDYPGFLVATTDSEGGLKSDESRSAFFRLFHYISGKNTTRSKIKMAAPVFRKAGREKIPMSIPVVQTQGEHHRTMAFVVPSKYDQTTVPIPTDPRVSIQEVPAGRVAVLRFTGLRSDRRFSKKEAELRKWIDRKHLEPLSGAMFAGYDPPWTIPFLRRNEVQIRVSTQAKCSPQIC